MNLYKHQQQFLEANPDIAILAWEAGVGKTVGAIEWLKLRPKVKSPLIIVTKAIKQKWKDELQKWGYQGNAQVITKEELKKDQYYQPDALIIDEAHHFSSPLFIAKDRSAMTQQLYSLIRSNPSMSRLLLTANVVRSNPANLHTLLYLSVKQIEWKKWQSRFYSLQHFPYLPRPAYLPVKGWQKMMPPIIAKYCSIALMKDCADVPVHEYTTIDIELDDTTHIDIKKLSAEEWEPMKLWVEEHRYENGHEKLFWIKSFSEGRRKIIVICRYKEQIRQYARELSKIRETFVLTGDTKDQEQLIADAQASDECFLIVQSQVTAGYDLDTFSTMVFASCSWSWVDHSQAHARINRIHNLHRNEYYYLVAGAKDKSILKSLEEKKDFDINSVVK